MHAVNASQDHGLQAPGRPGWALSTKVGSRVSASLWLRAYGWEQAPVWGKGPLISRPSLHSSEKPPAGERAVCVLS